MRDTFGLKGEGVFDDRVFMVKTHWPNRFCPPFQVRRAVVLVRNPFDVILSWWTFRILGYHQHTGYDSNPADPKLFGTLWHRFAAHEFEIWKKFHTFWLRKASKRFPVLVVRYEDLVGKEQSRVVHSILSFLGHTATTMQVSSAVKRIKMLYRPRSAGKHAGYSKDQFPASLQAQIQREAADVLCGLGYTSEIMGVLKCEKVSSLREEVQTVDTVSATGADGTKGTMTVNLPREAMVRQYVLKKEQLREMVSAVNLRSYLKGQL